MIAIATLVATVIGAAIAAFAFFAGSARDRRIERGVRTLVHDQAVRRAAFGDEPAGGTRAGSRERFDHYIDADPQAKLNRARMVANAYGFGSGEVASAIERMGVAIQTAKRLQLRSEKRHADLRSWADDKIRVLHEQVAVLEADAERRAHASFGQVLAGETISVKLDDDTTHTVTRMTDDGSIVVAQAPTHDGPWTDAIIIVPPLPQGNGDVALTTAIESVDPIDVMARQAGLERAELPEVPDETLAAIAEVAERVEDDLLEDDPHTPMHCAHGAPLDGERPCCERAAEAIAEQARQEFEAGQQRAEGQLVPRYMRAVTSIDASGTVTDTWVETAADHDQPFVRVDEQAEHDKLVPGPFIDPPLEYGDDEHHPGAQGHVPAELFSVPPAGGDVFPPDDRDTKPDEEADELEPVREVSDAIDAGVRDAGVRDAGTKLGGTFAIAPPHESSKRRPGGDPIAPATAALQTGISSPAPKTIPAGGAEPIPEGWATIADAAKTIGRSDITMHGWVSRGKLDHREVPNPGRGKATVRIVEVAAAQRVADEHPTRPRA